MPSYRPKKVFLSSTIHDLKHLRDAIYDQLIIRGYEVIASEKGTLRVNSNSHSYQNCIDRAKQCDYLLAIIGGRSGGWVTDLNISVTHAEINAAIEAKRKVMVCISQSVSDAMQVYKAYLKHPGLSFAKTSVVHDAGVLSLIEKITRNVNHNWIHFYYTADDILTFFDRQTTDSTHKLAELASKMPRSIGDVKHQILTQAGRRHSALLELFDEQIEGKINQCLGEIRSLNAGEFHPTGDDCVRITGRCFDLVRDRVLATSFPDPAFWNGDEAQSYFATNRSALDRGVKVTRYFIVSQNYASQRHPRLIPFYRAMERHFELAAQTSGREGPLYTVKLVPLERIQLPTFVGDPRQVPDVSYFDDLLVSRWNTARSDAKIYSSTITVRDLERGNVSRLFEALDRMPAATVESTEQVQKTIRKYRTAAGLLS